MKNRHGISYNFLLLTDIVCELVLEESAMQYIRFGAKAGQEQLDMGDMENSTDLTN